MALPVFIDTAIRVIYIGLSWVLFFSPAKEIWQIRKSKKTEQSPIPYLFLTFNSVMWVVFAADSRDMVVFLTFLLGIFTSTFYSLTIYGISSKKRLPELVLTAGLIVLGLISFVGAFFLNDSQRKLMFGACGIASSICVWTSPMLELSSVIRTRSSESMPLGLIAAVAGCCMYWLFYGIYDNNLFVIISNGCGVAAGWFQLIVVFAFKPTTVKIAKLIAAPILRLLSAPIQMIVPRRTSSSPTAYPKCEAPSAKLTANISDAKALDQPHSQEYAMQPIGKLLDDAEGDAALVAAEAAELAVGAAIDGFAAKVDDPWTINGLPSPPFMDTHRSQLGDCVMIDDAPLKDISLPKDDKNSQSITLGVPPTAERTYEKFIGSNDYPTIEEQGDHFKLVVQ